MGKEGRVFLRGMTSQTYGLSEFRNMQLEHNRVRSESVVTDDAKVAHSGDSEESRTWWKIGPGDDEFLTQTLQVHFVELPPGTSNHGHGHQNEALFYILEGKGYEIHDDKRYDWEKGDLVVVHNDSVHRHFNASDTERALCIIFKAKSQWMFLGLIQQGRSAAFEKEGFGPRVDWSQLWLDDVESRKKVVKPSDTKWEEVQGGRIRVMSSPERNDVRAFSVDVYEQEVSPNSETEAHLHMADEVIYVLSGSGKSLQWQVEAEIAEKYYAHIAKTPKSYDIKAGDVLYIPQNTIHQYINSSSEPLVFVSAQNRMFKLLGYKPEVHVKLDNGQPIF
ncbi:MAG: cupin domain-containing protein [Actinobacteria bacterium]|nr:cupin domain-containing protein [Actinomycetota bacterium]